MNQTVTKEQNKRCSKAPEVHLRAPGRSYFLCVEHAKPFKKRFPELVQIGDEDMPKQCGSLEWPTTTTYFDETYEEYIARTQPK